jgi:crotonobetainyl-CoA:carnitine CoA-transferase CaiB-like acyl-CoA transferase
VAGPLDDFSAQVRGDGPAADEARTLFELFGVASGGDSVDVRDRDPIAEWAASGAMWLTGEAGGPPLAPAAPIALRLRGAGAVLERLSTWAGQTVSTDMAALLGERAAIAGLSRNGRTSAGGACRLLRALDGWVAINLARSSDLDLLPAWLGVEPGDEPPWPAVEAAVASSTGAGLVERGQLLGIPCAVVLRSSGDALPFVLTQAGAPHPRVAGAQPLVIDLSSLWAGPLCAHLLGLAGADVVKVESTSRPDGARSGPAAFYDLLHSGHRAVALDFASPGGRRVLRQLLTRADIVIEGSRPRALRQLGIDAEELLRECPGLTWVSITGYGRSGPLAERVAFGDDAAAAAGLVCWTPAGPVFCGDAIADPMSGIYAAIGALGCWLGGGGWLVDVAMRDVAAHANRHDGVERGGPGAGVDVVPPRARAARGTAPALGLDTAAVLRALGIASG